MMGINFFRKLSNNFTGLNATTARFDILQSKLDALAVSMNALDAPIERVHTFLCKRLFGRRLPYCKEQ